MANHCSAGFPACRIAGFQTCVPCLFNHASERVCAPLFIGFFATLSKMAMKYPGWDRKRVPHCAVKRPITFSSASAGAWFSGVPMIVTRINRPRTEPLGTASVYSLPAPAD